MDHSFEGDLFVQERKRTYSSETWQRMFWYVLHSFRVCFTLMCVAWGSWFPQATNLALNVNPKPHIVPNCSKEAQELAK